MQNDPDQPAPRPAVMGIGEILWDMLPTGALLGGAPANFAYHAGACGADAHVASAVGDDALGRKIISRLKNVGVNCRCVTRDGNHPTGTVDVTLGANGSPTYVIHENVAWDNIQWNPTLRSRVESLDAICFGTLAQRSVVSRQTIQNALEAANKGRTLRVFDINLRQHYFNRAVIDKGLRSANVVKLNDEELPVVAKLLDLVGSQRQLLERLRDKYKLRLVALTRGKDGSAMLAPDEFSELPATPVDVVDTIGAGDAFTAAMVMGMLRERPLAKIHAGAARLAAYVCTQAGGTPAIPADVWM